MAVGVYRRRHFRRPEQSQPSRRWVPTVVQPGPVDLGTLRADAVSTASLALTAPTQVPLDASAAVSTATLALTAPFVPPPRRVQVTTQARQRALLGHRSYVRIRKPFVEQGAAITVPLAASNAVSSATLGLTAPTQIPLAASSATSSATLALTAPTRIPLNASTATSTATLALTAPTQIPLGSSTATSTATLVVTAPGATTIPLNPSVAVSTATLALTVVVTEVAASHGEGSEFALIRSRAREYEVTEAAASDTFPG